MNEINFTLRDYYHLILLEKSIGGQKNLLQINRS